MNIWTLDYIVVLNLIWPDPAPHEPIHALELLSEWKVFTMFWDSVDVTDIH